MKRIIATFERIIIIVLTVLMGIVVIVSTIELTYMLFAGIFESQEGKALLGLNDLFEAALCVVGYIGSLEWSVALSTVLLAGIGLLYWGWLASWWIHRQRQSART